MAIKNIGRQRVYGFPTAIGVQFPDPIVTVRDPQVTDVGGAIGQEWVNTDTPAVFFLVGFNAGEAVWVNVHGGAGVFTSLTVNPGPINLTGNLNVTGASDFTGAVDILGATTINVTGAAATTIGTGGTGIVSIGNATGNTFVTGQLVVSTDIFTTNGAVSVGNNAADATGPILQMTKSRAAGVITSGDRLGNILFTGHDGTTQISGAAITSTSSGTIAANRVAGNLNFFTHPDAAVANTSRMVIASTGEVTINTPDSGVGLTVSGGGATITAGDATLSNGNLVLSTAATYISLPGPVFISSGAGAPAGALALHIGDTYIRTDATGATERMYIATAVGAWTNVTCAA